MQKWCFGSDVVPGCDVKKGINFGNYIHREKNASFQDDLQGMLVGMCRLKEMIAFDVWTEGHTPALGSQVSLKYFMNSVHS
jgi:hypothetical protein